jgi:hypothetical protein
VTDIDVRCARDDDRWRCRAHVTDDGRTSAFDVTTGDPAGLLAPGTSGPTLGDVERLVAETFRFLLEREPVSSILSSFDLTIVARYFPEYPAEIRRRLSV